MENRPIHTGRVKATVYVSDMVYNELIERLPGADLAVHMAFRSNTTTGRVICDRVTH